MARSPPPFKYMHMDSSPSPFSHEEPSSAAENARRNNSERDLNGAMRRRSSTVTGSNPQLFPSSPPLSAIMTASPNRNRKKTVKNLQAATKAIIFQLKPVKEGHLLFKKKKRWIILDENNLYIFKNTEDYKAPRIIELQYSAVRKHSKEGIPGFEIVTSGQTFSFSEDKESVSVNNEIDMWIADIQKVCESLVMDSIGGDKEHNILTKTYSKLLSREDIKDQIGLTNNQVRVIEIAMREQNKYCADCKRAAPEWASTNLGVFICIDCSGIHRSFGTHISKVRSVKLDKWDDESIEHLDSIGNDKANQYWEATLSSLPSFTRIDENSNLTERKIWLELKYVKKRFTADWKEEEDLTKQRLNSQARQLKEIKQAANELKSREFKTSILKLLEDDDEFKNRLRVLLFSNVNFDLLRAQIEQFNMEQEAQALRVATSNQNSEESTEILDKEEPTHVVNTDSDTPSETLNSPHAVDRVEEPAEIKLAPYRSPREERVDSSDSHSNATPRVVAKPNLFLDEY